MQAKAIGEKAEAIGLKAEAVDKIAASTSLDSRWLKKRTSSGQLIGRAVTTMK